MHFLADVYVTCDVCNGSRYNDQTLEVKYKDKNISDVLNMTVEDALSFFDQIPAIKKKLQTIEHNLDVIKTADWIIDLGPEGGSQGGQLIANGSPEKVAKDKKSFTGKYLKEMIS